MKKSVWIFLFAVLLPSVVLGWLALRSAEEQQIVFERRTAELYQKETESLAVTVRDTVDAERRAFGETVHRLLAKGDAEALAHDFTNTLADAWEMKAVGFAINREGKLVSPSVAAASKKPELHRFLLGNGGFLTSTEPAIVYNWAGDNSAYRNPKLEQNRSKSATAQNAGGSYPGAVSASNSVASKDIAQRSENPVPENEIIVPTTSSAVFGNAPLTLGNSSGVSGGIVGMDPVFVQGAVNAGIAPGLNGTSTIFLSGGVQINCQVPANVSAFDFTGVMSAPDQRNLAGIFPQICIPAGSSAVNLMPQGITDFGKQENLVLLSDSPEQSPLLPVPMPAMAPVGAAAMPAPIEGVADKAAATQKAMPAPTDPVGGKERMRATGLADAAKKMKPAELATDVQSARKAAGAIAELKRDESARETAMPEKRADYPAAPPAPAPIRTRAPQPAVMSSERQQTLQPTAATPAAAPLEAEPLAKTKDQPQGPPAAKSPQVTAAPEPVATLRKSEMLQNAQKTSDDTATPQTKTGAANLLLSNTINRQVEPQQVLGMQGPALSTVMPEEAEFRSLTEDGYDGLVARFVQDRLNLIFWVRPPEAPEMVFGCLIEAGHFGDLWKDVLERHRSASRGSYAGSEAKPGFVLALLDDRGRSVATQPASSPVRDWKHPFVASEIGEALPHWEAALYLASPTALADSARGLWRTLAFTIAGAVALIAFGGWLVVADARQQLALAQQKTDFVSNVSHELKTPLTSIRMFAELMHDRPQPAEKQGQYLRIITVEAERLTRLINNVLDFAKIGRKQRRYEKKPLDLHDVVARVWESQELHLREAGFTTRWEAAPGPYPVLGDDDALAQVLVNLLSNAEKYSTGRKEVELHTWLDDGHVDIAVMDRGMGVPNGDDRKIFEAFYRAHDSLNSGIQGSGLGLTLAQRVAHEHGGTIKFERRDGGGCRFTLRLPLARTQESGIRGQGSGSRPIPDS
jgi:signal transduction histidine kinase